METLVDGLLFPECPRWHDGALYFSDQHDGIVWRLESGGARTRIAGIPGQPSGLGWLPDGTMLAVSMLDRHLLRIAASGPELHADLSQFASHSLNDMAVDSAGRAYVGNFGFDLDQGGEPRSTALLRVDADGSVHTAAGELWFPNGTVITPGGRTLIIAETFASRLTAFDIDAGGALSGRRVFAALEGLYPDGICLDAEGAVWVACAGAHKAIRVREGGEITCEIPAPDGDVFACMLGGDDGCDLFLCVAPHFRPHVTRPARAGRIQRARVEVPHAGLP